MHLTILLFSFYIGIALYRQVLFSAQKKREALKRTSRFFGIPTQKLKIPAASCRESPKCEEVFYCNSLANPVVPHSVRNELSAGRGMRSLCIFSGIFF
jgi:hypothetical protein